MVLGEKSPNLPRNVKCSIQEVTWIVSYQSLRDILYKYAACTIILDIRCGWRDGPLACLNDCSCVNPWDAACWGNVCISCSGNRRWLQNPHVLPTLALCSSPDFWHCLLPTQQASGRRPGWVSGSHGSFLPSFLPSWSCQSHILLSAAERLKILLTALEGCNPEPQYLIAVLSEPSKSWIKKEQSEICSLSPAAYIMEGFYSLSPMGHCKPWLSREVRRYSPQERVQLWYTPHLDTCRRKQGRWEEICGT